MPRVNVQLPLASDQRDVFPWSRQRLLNLYPEFVEGAQAKTQFALKPTEGQVQFCDLGVADTVRGLHVTDRGKLYVVAGGKMFTVDSTGTGTLLTGDAISGVGPVSFASNATQVCVVSGDGDMHVFDGTTIVQNQDADFLPSVFVTIMDGFGILLRQDSDEVLFTSIDDFNNIAPLDFFTAEKNSDILVSAAVLNDNLWLLGRKSIEVFLNSGNADLPFVRTTGGAIQYGCASAHCTAVDDNAVFFLDPNNTVYRASGPTPARISTHAIEDKIGEMAITSDAEGFIYTKSGHKFYVLNFPSGGECFVYDIATGAWHERASGTTYGGGWNVNGHAYAFRKNLVGAANGKIYQLDANAYTDAGATIVREAVTPALHSGAQQRVTMAELEIDLDGGKGLLTGQGSDPVLMLSWSDDGGRTYSNERELSTGLRGQYRHQVRTFRLGSFHQRDLRIRYSEPTDIAFLGLVADIKGGKA